MNYCLNRNIRSRIVAYTETCKLFWLNFLSFTDVSVTQYLLAQPETWTSVTLKPATGRDTDPCAPFPILKNCFLNVTNQIPGTWTLGFSTADNKDRHWTRLWARSTRLLSLKFVWLLNPF